METSTNRTNPGKNRRVPALDDRNLPHSWYEFSYFTACGRATPGFPLIINQSHSATDAFHDTIFHSVDYHSLSLAVGGRAFLFADGRCCAVRRGDVFAIAPGTAYAARSCLDFLVYDAIFTEAIFDATALAILRELPGMDFLRITTAGSTPSGRVMSLAPAQCSVAEKKFQALFEEFRRGSDDGRLMARLLLQELLVWLSRRHFRQEDQNALSEPSEPAFILSSLEYFEANFTEDIRIEAVAASHGLSPDRFSSEFKTHVRQTPRDYLKSLRIEQARGLLQRTSESVADIAWRCGFRDPSYFARVFQKTTGLTPREFRGLAPARQRRDNSR